MFSSNTLKMPPKSSSKSVKTKTIAPTIKTIGYLRVSTGDQELEKNKSDILHLANHLNLGRVIFVEEIVSGKVSWKKTKDRGNYRRIHKRRYFDRQRSFPLGAKYARMYGNPFGGS